MSIKRVIFSNDFLFSFVFTILIAIFLNLTFIEEHSDNLATVGITIFSIVFPLFFTSFSIIITSSDDEFAKYLQTTGFYQELISSFKFTLYLNFIALITSIFMKFYSLDETQIHCIELILYMLYIFICLYALFATFSAVLNSIEYAKYRGIYFNKK